MCLCSRSLSWALLMVPLATPVVSQSGSWLCHSSVCPRTSWPCCSANWTRRSAPDQSYVPWVGSTTCHFISLPGVTTENWSAAMAWYAGWSRSYGMTAVPMRRPMFAASARRESGRDRVARAGCPLRQRWLRRAPWPPRRRPPREDDEVSWVPPLRHRVPFASMRKFRPQMLGCGKVKATRTACQQLSKSKSSLLLHFLARWGQVVPIQSPIVSTARSTVTAEETWVRSSAQRRITARSAIPARSSVTTT